MNVEELNKYLQAGEGTTIEFKRCGNMPEADTFETICSFANRQGGSIFLGVNDDGSVIGIRRDRALEIQRNIVNRLNDQSYFNASPLFEFDQIEYQGRLVLRVWIPMSSTVHTVKGIAFDRIADADVKAETDSQLAAMYARKQDYYSERKIFRYLNKSDLRLELLDRFRNMAVKKRANHPWARMNDDELLRSANLFLCNYETGEEGFTLAAALLLGRDEVISSIVPAYKTDAYVQREEKDRYDDRIIVKTNLVESYDALLEFTQKHLPDKFFLEGTQSISLRDTITRELIVNSLVHREFTSPLPAKFVIDVVGIRTENANRPRFVGTLSPDKFNPFPKNPIIAEVFSNIGLAESLGSGTRNLFKYSTAYGGADPVLAEADVFEALVPLASSKTTSRTPLDVDKAIANMLAEQGYIQIADVAKLANVTERTVRRHVSPMVKAGDLVASGPRNERRYIAVGTGI